ncbi:MAG: IS66 family transposase [Anaerolineae bacterium]
MDGLLLDILMSSNDDARSIALPQDVASCHAMLESVLQSLQEKDQRINELEAIVHRLIDERLGRKSERYSPDQLALFTLADDDDSTQGEPPDDNDEALPPKRRRGGQGRRRLDPNARREERIHRLRPDQKQCPKCGAALTIVLVEGKLCWAYQPAEIYGLQHLHEKAFCNCCHEHVQIADMPPSMIEKGAADASLLAHLTTCKQGDHLTLYRYEEISLRNGWWIPRSTQAGWLYQTAVTAVILYAWMASRILQGKLIGTDATGVPVLDPGAGQVRKGTVWTYCGQQEVCPYLIYDYWPTGEGEAPRRFLQGYEGYLQADAASVFDQLFLQGPVLEVACGAHMRRYFYKARHSAPFEAHRALGYFRQLYMLERELADVTQQQRRAQRRLRALPILGAFRTWLDELWPQVVPKTEIATAVGYALNQWEAFVRYCDEGWLIIDNTRSERALRPIAIGRSNWMFFGSDGGGHTGAILYSLVASCKANRVHPYHYLKDVYERLPMVRQHPSLLPWLQEACADVIYPDGRSPNPAHLQTAIGCLRVLKDHPRPLIELMRDPSRLDGDIVVELTELLPDRWHDAHEQFHLEINRKTRLVGEPA